MGLPADTKADAAHWKWLTDEDNAYFAWSDQMVEGKAHGSRYYPRGVTSALWICTDGINPFEAIRNCLLGEQNSQSVAQSTQSTKAPLL